MSLKKKLLLSVLLMFAIDVLLWGTEHFHFLAYPPYTYYFAYICYFVIALAVVLSHRMGAILKIGVVVGMYIFAILSSYIIILGLILFIPGYKERDWVLYGVCRPALEKYHTSNQTNPLDNAVRERTKCLQNVWADRDPLYGFE